MLIFYYVTTNTHKKNTYGNSICSYRNSICSYEKVVKNTNLIKYNVIFCMEWKYATIKG